METILWGRTVKTTLSTDGKHVSIKIDKSLTTGEVESLISDLALLRGQMTPEVARERPTPDSGGDIKVSVQDDPDLQLKLLRDGRIRLWIRNRGLGWLVFNIPVGNACYMRDYLVENTPTVETAPGFFGDEFADGGVSH